ncbi:hypothetical protein [Citrobacter tructae]|uniref:hypothetical protein n=1 Tax=Citrobacter tructae TaxID=2562449 RepID=UPI003F5669B4
MKRSFTLSKLALVLSILLTTTSRPAFGEYNKDINNDVLNVREDIFVDGLDITGKEANYYGDVTIDRQYKDKEMAGIIIDGDIAQFLGKTSVNVVRIFNPEYPIYQNVTGVYLKDALPSRGFTQGKRVFSDLTITGSHPAFPGSTADGPIYGIYYQGGEGNIDLSVQKLNIDISGSTSVEGIYLRDFSPRGTSKFRFEDVNIKLTGDDDTWIHGFMDSVHITIRYRNRTAHLNMLNGIRISL